MQAGEEKDASLPAVRLAKAKPYHLFYWWRHYTDLYASCIQNVEQEHRTTSLFLLTLWLGLKSINVRQRRPCVLGSLVRADGGEGGGPLPRWPGQDRSSHRHGTARQIITWLSGKSRDFQTNHVTFRQITCFSDKSRDFQTNHVTFRQITWLSEKSRDFQTNHVTFRQITWLLDKSRDFQTNHMTFRQIMWLSGKSRDFLTNHVTFRQITWHSDKSRDFQTNHVTARQIMWLSSSQSEMRRPRPCKCTFFEVTEGLFVELLSCLKTIGNYLHSWNANGTLNSHKSAVIVVVLRILRIRTVFPNYFAYKWL